jgi:hypothetical protein
VSGDGHVACWIIVKDMLFSTNSMEIPFDQKLEHFDYQGKINLLKGAFITLRFY